MYLHQVTVRVTLSFDSEVEVLDSTLRDMGRELRVGVEESLDKSLVRAARRAVPDADGMSVAVLFDPRGGVDTTYEE